MVLEKGKIFLSVMISVSLLITGIFLCENIEVAEATSYKATISNYVGPGNIYKGNPISIGGIIKSSQKMRKVIIGVANLKGKMINGAHVIVNLKKRKYNIAKVDSKIKFGKLKPGKYLYKVIVISGSNTKTLVNKSFTVSYIYGYKINSPKRLTKGKSYSLKGYVKSNIKLNYVRVGIANKKGNWKKRYSVSVNPKRYSYNIAKADSHIKFDKLPKGTYRYKITAKDVSGKSVDVVNRRFKVSTTSSSTGSTGSNSGSSYHNGRVLSYNPVVIAAIGRQKVSGPCGIYSMAYVRAILDGGFSRGKYKTSYARIRKIYGYGSNSAHWYLAGGSSTYYTSTKSCYRQIIRQINMGRPCIMNMHNNATGNNHYVAVIGYVKGTTEANVNIRKFVYLDPVTAYKRYMSETPNYVDSDSPQLITF